MYALQVKRAFVACDTITRIGNKKPVVPDSDLQQMFGLMAKYIRYPAVQDQGCMALSALAAEEANQQVIVDSDGLDRVFAAMEAHLASATIQKHACKALRRLASASGSKFSVVSPKGLQLVYAAMDKHLKSTNVQKNGCLALKKFAGVSVHGVKCGKAAILSGRGLEVIQRAKTLHPTEPLVVAAADGALGKLA